MSSSKNLKSGKIGFEAEGMGVESPQGIDTLFNAWREADSGKIRVRELLLELERAGIRARDPRLAGLMKELEAREAAGGREVLLLDDAEFAAVVDKSASLVRRTLSRDLVIPDFATFRDAARDLLNEASADRSGEVATYIPQLARVDPDRLALGLCTVDGQRWSAGDFETPFCLQSTCKPVNYCLALDGEGESTVHRHVGREPSGQTFNELSLNSARLPHNPMINAGAIMSCALIGRSLYPSERFEAVLDTWTGLTGGRRPGFNNSIYLSEKRTADRNYALGYFMREHGAFPKGTQLEEVLEFYFQCCSLELNAEDFAVAAATLANGGVCPLTDQRILSARSVRNVLSLMSSCGMYDFSGEWAFTVGVPAKSGVSGVIMVVVPNTVGFVVWSPRLDRHGNSVRGVRFTKAFARQFGFHCYDNLVTSGAKDRDPRAAAQGEQAVWIGELLWAARRGDIPGLRRLRTRGVDLRGADYDGRTAMHVASAEGRLEAVQWLLDHGADPQPVDRWNGTPLDDALREGREEIAQLLRPL